MEIPAELRTTVYKLATNAITEAAAKYALSEYLGRDRMALWMGVSTATLDKYTRMGLKCHIVEGHKLWRKSEVVAWLDQFTI